MFRRTIIIRIICILFILISYLYFVNLDPILCEDHPNSSESAQINLNPEAVYFGLHSIHSQSAYSMLLNSHYNLVTLLDEQLNEWRNLQFLSNQEDLLLTNRRVSLQQSISDLRSNITNLHDSVIRYSSVYPDSFRNYGDFILYSSGSYISEDMVVGINETPIYISNQVSHEVSRNITDNTIQGNISDRVHPAIAINETLNMNEDVSEIIIPKVGMSNKIRLCFSILGGKVNRVYVKYHGIGKRKLMWNLWEKDRGKYCCYRDFKKNFDPNMKIFKVIYKDTKIDLKSDIKNLLNRDDPFGRSLNNRNVSNITNFANNRI